MARVIESAVASLSARTLSETTVEQVHDLSRWNISIPACSGYSNEPKVAASPHPLARILLESTGTTGGFAVALSPRCWKNRYRNETRLFDSEYSFILCDPLDPELMYSTERVAREDEELWQRMMDDHPNFQANFFVFGGLFASKEFLQYQYISPFLKAFAQISLSELVDSLPDEYRLRANGTKLVVLYNSDVLMSQARREERHVLVSGPVLRAAYLQALESAVAPLTKFRLTLDVVDEDFPARRDAAVEHVANLAAPVLLGYRRKLAFTFAHELAHIYSPQSTEEEVDCLALRNLARLDRTLLDPSLFSMLVADFVTKRGDRWGYNSDTPERLERLLQRKAKIDRAAKEIREGSRQTEEYDCIATH